MYIYRGKSLAWSHDVARLVQHLSRSVKAEPSRTPPGIGAAAHIHRRQFTSVATPDFPPRPTRSLAGKAAIVTGAGTRGSGLGNGRAIALLLAADGCNVLCADLNAEWAAATADLINSSPSSPSATAASIAGDVASPPACAAIVAACLARFGRLDILVNSVGVLGARGTAETVDPAEWARGLEVNVGSMMLMAKQAVPAMRRNERDGGGIRGSIVNMGSVAGLRGGTPHLLYPTAKGAVVNMTRAMAAHHAAEGVRVNCVCPGMLYTPMMSGGMTPERREARRKRSLLQTEGNAWDCAAAVRFLAGGEARWITGTVLTVDAGATAATSIPGLD